MNTLKSNLIVLIISLLIFGINKLHSQITTTSFPSTNIYNLQSALGSSANYFTLTSYMDSLINGGYIADTSEDDNTAKYMKWDWFWKGRVSNLNNPNLRGDFSQYLKLINQYSQAASSCPQNTTSIQYNWNIKGPTHLTTQNLGRIDVVRTLPSNPLSTLAYAGASTSGLWRTNNYLLTNPQWENITDNINLPNLGVSDMVIDTINPNIAYIVGEYTGWSQYSLGLFKTTNLNSSQPSWTKILGGPNNGFTFKIGKVLLGNGQNVFVLRDNEIYWSSNAGVNFSLLADIPTLIGSANTITTGFIIDKYNSNILYIATYEYNGLYFEGKLWKLDLNTPTILTQILLTSPATGEIKLDNGQFGTYVLYNINNTCTQYNIDKTINSGVSWINHNQISSGARIQSGLPIFEISDANDNIIYLEGGDVSCGSGQNRRIIKSLDAGTSFIPQHSYWGNGTTHADIRAFYMASPSNDGLNDEFFVGNDGGILYSSASNNVISGHQVNWENKNGNGLAITQFYGLGQTQKDIDVYAGGAQDNGMLRSYSDIWNVSIINGDGYEVFFKKNEPDKSFRLDGLGWSGFFFYSSDYLTSETITGISDVAVAKNGCKARYYRQSIVESNNIVFTSFHDVHKYNSISNSWQKISNFTSPSIGIPDNHIIEAIAVSHQNTNIIYAGYGQPTWNADMSTLTNGCSSPTNSAANCPTATCPIAKKLYKTTDGGTSWLDISANFDNGPNSPFGPRWFGITDMVVSPTNDNDLWIAFDGIGDVSNYECGGVNRVTVTHDGGITWTDYSNNLPYLPINKIVYYEGTNDGLFVATDIGVYYTDANLYSTNGWIKVSTGLPACIVTDIDINYCRQIIRISTYGRGIWEADLQLPYASNLLDITSNIVWNSDRDVITDVRIRSGSSLTISNLATINIAKDKKIIIEKGAKLIIDGATLTNQCGQLWRGIEVNGDRNASQLTAGAQGILEIKNGALIENARFAVRTSETDANDQTIWNTFGGIVKVSNSTFKNNRSGIDFSPYQNFVPGNPSSKLNDLSVIKNNTFIWDNTGNLEALGIPFYSHIGMWDNHGIDVVGNIFKNDHPISTPQYQTGIGLVTYDTDCRVINNCVSPFYPCPTSSIIPNQFDNLKIGVHSLGVSNIARMHIDGNVFNNNKYGVVLEAAHYSSVIRNEFNVPISNLTLQQGGNAIGIYSTNAFGYNFEENTFNSTGPEPVNGSNYAIVADNSLSTGGGLVYKNEFNNMVVGTVSSNDNTLLKIDCNDYNAGNLHQYDWAVTSGALAPQGLCNSQLVDPAKNAFSTNCTGEKHIFVDGSANLLLYSALFADLPVCYTGGKVFGSNCGFGQNQCQSNFANPLSGPQLLSSIGALNNEINNNLLPQLDGGNTQNLLNIINSQSGGQVKNALLAASPYLSDEVLIHYLNQNPAHGLVKQIILANSPVSVQVMEIINNMSLPNGTRNQIESAQTGISDRQLLENDIAVLTRDAQLLKNEFVRLCLDSHQYQDVSTILAADNSVADKIALFRLTVEENPLFAGQVINDLMADAATITAANPADGEADEIEKLCSIYTGIHDAYSNTGSFDSLTGANEVTVTNIANSNSATAVNAQIILNLFKAENFDRYAEPITNNTSSSRLNNTTSNNNQQTVNNYSLNNYPNPFNQNTYIEATLPEGATGQLVITDITGRVVKRIELVDNDNKIEISGNQIGYGIFFYSLYVNEQYIRTNKMTRTK